MSDVIDIACHFAVNGNPIAFKECTEGHINNTYIVDFKVGNKIDRYVLQKINTYVFKNPEYVMSNIIGVTTYLRSILKRDGGDVERGTLTFVQCENGAYYYRDDQNGCWRMYHFIDNVISYVLADSTELFEKAGVSFGNFQLLLAGYDASTLYETIPNFHNTKHRFVHFLEVLKKCPEDRRKMAEKEIEFVIAREKQCAFIVDEIAIGSIPVRVTHNDTKLNNILMDAKTGDGVCIIDLDTVMPGSALYDFGDAIRFGASSALEDETDLDKVFFRADMFRAFAKGYIHGAGGAMTRHEIECLPQGAHVITFETGMRFLTDYLENDVYFKTAYPSHNLVRAKNQFKLVYDLETRMNEFNSIVREFI